MPARIVLQNVQQVSSYSGVSLLLSQKLLQYATIISHAIFSRLPLVRRSLFIHVVLLHILLNPLHRPSIGYLCNSMCTIVFNSVVRRNSATLFRRVQHFAISSVYIIKVVQFMTLKVQHSIKQCKLCDVIY